MYNENDLQQLLSDVRAWITDVKDNQDMLTKDAMLHTFMSRWNTHDVLYQEDGKPLTFA